MIGLPGGGMAVLAGVLLVATAAPAALRPPGPTGVEVTDPVAGWPEPPGVTAAAFVLADAVTGQVLAARAPDTPRPVASTVKMLTALSVLERAELDEIVTAGDEVREVGGAGVGIAPGDRWTVGELLAGMIARSGNDAAVTLAAHVGGSVEDFVALMRADAAALGLHDAVLHSPTGLDDANRLTARQLATIARAALADARFRTPAARAVVDLPGIGRVPSRNLLLGTYPGATGVKTGHTDAAGWSLVASARRAGRELVAVVLDSASDTARFDDARALLDHGFDRFRPVRLGRVRLRRAGEWVELTAPRAAVLVPAGAGNVQRTTQLPGTVDDGPASAVTAVRWNDLEIGRATVTGSAGRPPARSTEALGRWLGDRVHASLRAATSAGLWSVVEGRSR